MKKLLIGILVLATVGVHAQSKKAPVKQGSSKRTTKADSAAVERVEPADDAIPVQEEVIMSTADGSSGSLEKPATNDSFTIYANYRDKNLSIAYEGNSADNRRYGLVENDTRKEITPFIFDNISGFLGSDYSQVAINGKYGVINAGGQIVVPCIYDEMDPIAPDSKDYKGYHLARKNGRSGVISDKNETIVPFEYDDIESPSYLLAGYLKVVKGGKVGVLDLVSHKLTIPAVYDNVHFQSEKYAQVEKGPLHSMLRITGEPLFSNWYTNIEWVGPSLSMAIAELNGRKGVIDTAEKKILPFEYDAITLINTPSSQLIFIVRKGGRYGVLGVDGKALMPLQYEQITEAGNHNMFLVAKNNKKGLLGMDGKEILPLQYDEITSDEMYYIVKKNSRFGVLNYNGEIVLPAEYSALSPVSLTESSAKYLLAVKNGKKGIIDMSTGKPRFDFVYDDLIAARRNNYTSVETFNNTIIAMKNGRYGMIDMSGSVLLPFEYDDLESLNSYLVIAAKDGKYGVVNIYNGNTLLPFEYQFVNNKKGVIIAYKRGYERYRLTDNKLISEEK
jgi:hypothetical protein